MVLSICEDQLIARDVLQNQIRIMLHVSCMSYKCLDVDRSMSQCDIHNLCFVQKYETYQPFSSELCHFFSHIKLEYAQLHRHISIMSLIDQTVERLASATILCLWEACQCS